MVDRECMVFVTSTDAPGRKLSGATNPLRGPREYDRVCGHAVTDLEFRRPNKQTNPGLGITYLHVPVEPWRVARGEETAWESAITSVEIRLDR